MQSDLCRLNNYHDYNIEKQNNKFSDNHFLEIRRSKNKKKLNKNEIVDDLKLNILKNNLEKKKNDVDDSKTNKNIENLILKEILFYQLIRLYTSNDNKLIKSFIITKINELIIKDNMLENLMLLSKIQILKNSNVNKKKLKKKKLKKILKLISSQKLTQSNSALNGINKFYIINQII